MNYKSVTKIFAIAALSLFAACSSTDVKDSSDPEVIYNEGARLLKERDFLIAEDHFSEVRRRFPQSRFAVLSQLASADLEYEQENFLEAAAAYGFFVDQFPRHEESARAQFRRADSFFRSAPTKVARDQSQVSEAIQASRDFLRKYPASPLKEKVVRILEKGRLRLAEKEAYVAAFYEKKEKNLAAARRWKGLLKDYQDISTTDSGTKLLKRAETRLAALDKEISKE